MTSDLWLLRGLLVCDKCQHPMIAAHDTDQRVYSCGPACPQFDLPATCAEQDMLLGALVRGTTTLYADLSSQKQGTDPAPWFADPREPADEANVQRWQSCDMTDRRAVLNTAYVAVLVTDNGQLQPVWRHNTVDLAQRVMAAVAT